MDSLARAWRHANRQAEFDEKRVPTNPYIYRLISSPTLYNSTLTHTMDVDWTFDQGLQKRLSALSLGVDYSRNQALDVMRATDQHYAQVYVEDPALIVSTEEHIRREPKLREEVAHPIEPEKKMADMAAPIDLGGDFGEPVLVKVRRPKFWTLKGSGSLQFTQSYYSDNWYQGGEKNYAELSSFTLQANFDNKQKIQWDNKLEVQLGFQTSSDTVHRIKVTSNLLRYTGNFGYQATKSWYYTASVVTYTQIMRYFDTNANTYSTEFASPLYLTLSVGMTYKFSSKQSKFSGSLLLSPVAYNMRYVGCDSLRSCYSVEEGKVAYHNFGPSLTMNFKLVPCNNVTWESRIYYFTNLSYVDFEWENTFTFTINKYLSSKLFIYPRFDDSSTAYRGNHGYFMFKEWLSLGLSFDF